MVSDNNVTLYDINYNNDIYDIIISDIGLLDKNKQYKVTLLSETININILK